MIRGLCIAAALAVLALASAAGAADEAQVLRQQAEHLASQDRCDEALERARRARALDPGEARAWLVEGRCLLRAGRYAEAIEPLERARELDPGLDGVSTDLAQCRYHLGQYEAAREEIRRAEARDPDEARMQLYRGLLLLRDAEEEEAAAAFDRAASLDPSLADAASLYAGRTWAGLEEREKAEAALERARAADPDSPWAREAARELERLEERHRRRMWLRIEGGIEHDTNVPLLADIDANQLSQEEFGPFAEPEKDMRGIFEAEAGVELLRSPDWSAGFQAGYQGNAHTDEHEFDLQSPWGALWLDRRLCDDTWLRLQPFGGYMWLETDPFVAYGGGSATVSTLFDEAWAGKVFARVSVNDFLFPIRTPGLVGNQTAIAERARNRDGVSIESGVEATHMVLASETRLRAGSAYERYQAEGRDWSRHGSRTWVGLLQPLPWNSRFEAEGRFTYRKYDDPSSFLPPGEYFNAANPNGGGGPDRREELWEVETELAHRVTEWLELAVHWRYQNQDSNTRVFDYDRHVAGGTFTLFFGHY